MPTRNFWIEATIDGRKTKLTGGPRSKDGGFNLIVYQRSKGQTIKSIEIQGKAIEEILELTIWDSRTRMGNTTTHR